MKRTSYTGWRSRQKGKGFSLTELAIVIIIIAILALAVFAGGSAAIRKAKISRATSDLHNFDVAIQHYMGFKKDPVKLTNLSQKADFDKVIDGLNPFLPMGYSVESVSLPTSGNIYSSVSSLNIYESEKKDPWDNPYYLLIEAQERNVGCTEYYFTVISAGPGAQADIGGPVDKDDIFLLCQYSNGTVSSHTYSMEKDKQDTTGTPLTVGVTSLSSLYGNSNPRNIGSTAPSNPGGSGGSGGSGGLPGTERPGSGGAGGSGGSGGTGGSGGAGSGGSGTAHTHTWGEWTNVNETTHERTCTADSSHKETEVHTWGTETITKAATCVEPGEKTVSCTKCGNTKTETIPAGEHVWDAGVVTKEPTLEPGVKTYTCTVCHTTKTEEIPVGDYPYLTFTSANAFSITAPTPKRWNNIIQYSLDTTTWTTWDGTQIDARTSDGGYSIYLRGYGNSTVSNNRNWTISGTEVQCIGNIETLLNCISVSKGIHPSMTDLCFAQMFNGCTSLTTAPELPATTLASSCYFYMFAGCTNLKIAPELPATNVNFIRCYGNMFTNCTSLTKAPELPAETLGKYCYASMFSGCTGLTTAPALPATTLAESCYNCMFQNCTKLTTAPALPATTLASSCYSSMFSSCTGLTTARELPATSLAVQSYSNMFSGCTSLTTVPELPATTLASSCYQSMFQNCTSLTAVPELPATTLASSCYQSMFQNCTSLTAAPELPATTLENSCYRQMFYKCTRLTSAPALPATTLANNCYENMFSGCKSITTAPALPATTLAQRCYYYMFSSCTGLTTAPALPATTLASSCYSGMFYGCTKLSSAPALPATTLAPYCYSNMFSSCTSLTKAPSLPATTLTKYCYENMFNGCASLTTAPALPATTLAGNCYSSMFSSCTSLTTAPALPATTLAPYCYKIVLAAGDGKLDDSDETQKSYDKVRDAIANYEKTITLSVGQLTTGVTIPEWTAVLMLSNVKSPALYMQAAFRAQNPCMFHENGAYFRKENAYVFDFDPARTLTIFEEFANDLSSDTASGRGDMDTRKQHVRELLNFFPVIGEDENGEMIALDAEKVLSIPRKIRSQEVVRRGFMSNYLFQNISGIFGAPQEVIDIISQFTPVEEPKAKEIPITPDTKDELNINPETGEVEIPQEQVIGTATEVFGEKIYGAVEDGTFDAQIKNAFENAASKTPEETRSAFDEFKEKFKGETVKGIIDIAKGKYQENIRTSDANSMAKNLGGQFDRAAEKVYSNYQIEQRLAENDRLDALRSRHETGKSEAEIEAEFERKKQELQESLQDRLSETVKDFIETSTQNVVETVEKKIKEREKTGIEDAIRDHLRGFSRTIPSFLMAYGDDTVTLATFDSIIPNRVFVEVTSITLDQFRFLRDGGKYTDAETGEEKQFAGNLFDPVVFDDSVKEFLRLKKKLADYFDEKSIEDIFDYIPPQKTNQIFTPKVMVKKMVDMLEDENPGCFDDPDKTFIDLYMKSGLYITEIVKRLYQSERMKALFPDKKERLRHIFEKQVYGLAPTEIIYNIALSYILGFDENVEIKNHNFRQVDALPYAKEGTLSELLDELFGE